MGKMENTRKACIHTIDSGKASKKIISEIIFLYWDNRKSIVRWKKSRLFVDATNAVELYSIASLVWFMLRSIVPWLLLEIFPFFEDDFEIKCGTLLMKMVETAKNRSFFPSNSYFGFQMAINSVYHIITEAMIASALSYRLLNNHVYFNNLCINNTNSSFNEL